MVAYIVYSDIRNHTAWAERNSSHDLVRLLEGYYTLPKGTPFNFNAISDQMAIFYENCDSALSGGLELKRCGKGYFSRFGLKLGVAIHKGHVSKIKFFYGSNCFETYTSHSVCIASRLSRLSENGEMIVSKDIYEDLNLNDRAKFRNNGSFTLKGRGDLIETFVCEG